MFNTTTVLSILENGGKRPSYLKPCSLSDPNFEQCCLEHGREAIPHLLNGDKKYNIPKLVPLIVPYVTVDAGENLKVYLKNIKAYGLDKIDLQQLYGFELYVFPVDGKYQYDADYTLKKIDGEQHMSISDNDQLTFDLRKAEFHLDNLFNGDKVLGPQMNAFLNENWKDVINEIGGAISHTVESLVRAIATGVFDKISYADLFTE
ncbi:hypothetical protein NQ318_009808 [Aromia moschata]|uniref:Uncharacterized protein n=1 Tax=Aromia moschata TaxID=1265417 RepID=A0AAV8XLE4_9CUCU|nr:hypothetical protein NQ318_009808 [Aromia moschata]